jgi:hypothetical protein
MFLVLLALLLIFGPIPFLLLGAASLSALLTVGLPIVAVILLVWLVLAILGHKSGS